MFLTDVGQSKLILHSLLSSSLVVPGGKRGLQTPDPHTKSSDAICACLTAELSLTVYFSFFKFSQNTKVIGAYCTTTTADAESNLLVLIQSPPNHNRYSCVCRSSGGNPHCALHYWACPIHAP